MSFGRFLTVYDYGMGGVWVWILADSEDDVRRAFPQLQIVNEAPDAVDVDRIRTLSLDADDEYLNRLREDAKGSGA
jgi:hypothetical protein